ncbi:MAG: hypothetical protein LBD59_10100 [Prevotellaceae bacterium]|nr:hypothetical protein [Prevotellaceae bacterium]
MKKNFITKKMETETIQKNAASLKSRMNGTGKMLLLGAIVLLSLQYSTAQTYSSNFDDNVFDGGFWKKELGSNSNNVIRVENGVMKLEQNKTDVTPYLISKDLSFDSDIVMERDVYLQKANDYLYANSTFIFNNRNQIQFSYFYTKYEENYKEGIHLIQDGRNTDIYKNIALDFKADKDGQGRGYRMNLPINTILDKWFHEKIIISKNGIVTYFVDNKQIGSYDLSKYLNLSSASTFNVNFTPTGWWTGHKHYFDNFSIASIRKKTDDEAVAEKAKQEAEQREQQEQQQEQRQEQQQEQRQEQTRIIKLRNLKKGDKIYGDYYHSSSPLYFHEHIEGEVVRWNENKTSLLITVTKVNTNIDNAGTMEDNDYNYANYKGVTVKTSNNIWITNLNNEDQKKDYFWNKK